MATSTATELEDVMPTETSQQMAAQTLPTSTVTQMQRAQEHLPSADTGPLAYRFLFAAFILEAFQWGFALSFGVFQNYYSTHPPFAGSPDIPVVGTLATGVTYLGAPFMTPLIRQFPAWRRQMIWTGWAVSILSLVGASFARSIGALIVTQGALYSLGVTILYFPMIGMLNEWFVAKRGLALGLVTAATGFSGIVMPFVLAVLLERYGHETTLRAVAVALVVLTGPVLPMVRERLPVSHSTSSTARTGWEFLKKPLFWFFAASVLLQGLGHFFPTLFLPSYADALGYSPAVGALLLALFSLTQVFGQVSCGYLSDRRVSVEMLAFIFPLISAISILTLWGLARSLAPLIVFSLLYGFWGGGYVVLWAKMCSELSDDPTVALMAFGTFAFLKGVGNVITGPISAELIRPQTLTWEYAVGKYMWIVSYSGVCMFACSIIMVVLFFVRRLKETL